MNFNTDGFNERTNYIHNSNDMNRLKKNGPNNFDNSFAQMKSRERRPDLETTNQDKTILKEDVRGSRDNFVLMNNNLRNIRNSSLNRNMFKK